MSGKFAERLAMLDPPPAARIPDGMTEADAATMRAFGFLPSAKG